MALTRSDDGSEQLNLRDQAYSAFTQGLLSQTLKPGQFISQRELADRHRLLAWGYSRTDPAS